jgi:hypothetical protein
MRVARRMINKLEADKSYYNITKLNVILYSLILLSIVNFGATLSKRKVYSISATCH